MGKEKKSWKINYLPRSHNRSLRTHWGVRKAERDTLQKLVLFACGVNRNTPDRAAITIQMYRVHLQDKDNRYASVKPLVDVLVKCGWAKDDKPENLDLEVEEYKVHHFRDQHTRVEWEAR